MRLLLAEIVVLLGCGCTIVAAAETTDYPTVARAEYVFACMASNGQTQQALRQCACSIDVIASVLPYDRYEQAETVLRMRRTGGGYIGEVFRSKPANSMVRELQEAQAEGEVRCF
jgi:hypothetical protein